MEAKKKYSHSLARLLSLQRKIRVIEASIMPCCRVRRRGGGGGVCGLDTVELTSADCVARTLNTGPLGEAGCRRDHIPAGAAGAPFAE